MSAVLSQSVKNRAKGKVIGVRHPVKWFLVLCLTPVLKSKIFVSVHCRASGVPGLLSYNITPIRMTGVSSVMLESQWSGRCTRNVTFLSQ
jgi:hypothetical protein